MSKRAVTLINEYESRSRRPFDTPKRSKFYATVDVIRDLDLIYVDGRPIFTSKLIDYNSYLYRRR